MPTETFYHLKEEKQQRILDAALHEIAENGYEKAGVTRIVKNAGIATGSFYQYFKNMEDLFIYVALEAGRLKSEYIRRALAQNNRTDFESVVRAIYGGGMRFGLEHEEYYRCAESLLQMKDPTLYRKMIARAEKSELAILLFQAVNRAIDEGELNENITPELLFQLLTSINATIIEYLLNAKPNKKLSPADVEKLCELGVQIILHGIGNPKQPNTAGPTK